MSKELLTLALEAVEIGFKAEQYMTDADYALQDKAVAALREALAEQPAQQEPVAWMTKDGEIYKHECWPEHKARPLVFGDTSPPAQRTWVGLTDEEKLHIEIMGGKSDVMLAEMVEAKLKERNQ